MCMLHYNCETLPISSGDGQYSWSAYRRTTEDQPADLHIQVSRAYGGGGGHCLVFFILFYFYSKKYLRIFYFLFRPCDRHGRFVNFQCSNWHDGDSSGIILLRLLTPSATNCYWDTDAAILLRRTFILQFSRIRTVSFFLHFFFIF